MTEEESAPAADPVEAFIAHTQTELEQVRRQLQEIGLLVEQSQGEVDKLASRNASITAHLHQMQSQFDTVPREDIRSTYEAFQDAQQRLFTMRGQLEKLQSDEGHLQRYEAYLSDTFQLLQGRPKLDVAEEQIHEDSAIQHIIEAQEEERRTISRRIHDGPAQALSNFILQTEIALRLFGTDQERAREELNNLKGAASSTFNNVRDFIFDLRPMMLDDLGLVPTARRYAEAFQEKSGLDISTVVTGSERRLEPHREVLAFRAIQTLLRNTREYAQATQTKIMVDMGDHQVRVTVEDNGSGFDPETLSPEEYDRLGFTSLEDRIQRVGGTIEIDSSSGEGTRVSFTIPSGD
jgi:two-component system sensor histidine kinase DegS